MSSPGSLAVSRPGRRLIWSGRLTSELQGLDGWVCKWPSLARYLRETSELVVLDALSFPWDLLTSEHRTVPLVVALPPDLDARAQSSLLGEPLFQYVSPFDSLIHHDAQLQAAISRRWGIPTNAWLTPSGASWEEYLDALRELSMSRLVTAQGDIGVFRMESDDLITRHILEHGAHQRGTLNLALSILRPGDTVIDAGAHVGTFSVPLCRKVQPGGRLIAVEGDPVNASLLRHNLDINGMATASTVVQAVLGKAGETVVAHGEVGNTGATRFARANGLAMEVVEATTIDQLAAEIEGIQAVTLLKLDLEGSELDALTGGSDVISRTQPTVICEVSPKLLAERAATVQELGRWLSDRDYLLYAITGPRNFRGEGWEVVKIERLEEWPESHFDAIAVPSGSAHVRWLDSGSSGG